MKLELITLIGKKLDKDVYEVVLPTADGEIAVFPGHEPLITLAVPGVIAVRHNKSDVDFEYFATSGGVIEVSPTLVRVLVDEADHGEEIIESEAKAALERARAMQANAKDQVELEEAHQLVDRHAVRLKVAELRRRYHRNQ
ncbi:ATP synthase F1, epsilon subunit [candidate division TM7 genomosp. GTL1]|nr:ATP synthase F1, epsilon subunit [candidate division TM7 genomosp. GTL1]